MWLMCRLLGESSEGSVGMAMQQEDRGVEDHETVTGGQQEEGEWVTWKKGRRE